MMNMGLTFDTGALIGLERSRHYMRKVYDVAVSHDVRITVPSVVVAEWWRAGEKEKDRARILRSVAVESISDLVARLAGVALTLAPRAHTIDAIVMASASQRPDEIVYTSDPKDLQMLRDCVPQFRSMRIERV
jgi:predicted nucleic acid-binding protein